MTENEQGQVYERETEGVEGKESARRRQSPIARSRLSSPPCKACRPRVRAATGQRRIVNRKIFLRVALSALQPWETMMTHRGFIVVWHPCSPSWMCHDRRVHRSTVSWTVSITPCPKLTPTSRPSSVVRGASGGRAAGAAGARRRSGPGIAGRAEPGGIITKNSS